MRNAHMTDSTTSLDAPLRRHRWNEIEPLRLSGQFTTDGNDRTVKTCAACGLQKITVHPPHGFPWNEWRSRRGHVLRMLSTPPCITGEVEP
jgi:hypothetical protein